jgi:hypothetical protein
MLVDFALQWKLHRCFPIFGPGMIDKELICPPRERGGGDSPFGLIKLF